MYTEADGNQSYAVHWEPPPESAYKWKHKHPPKPKSLRIYECHIGISGQEPKISTFNDFTQNVVLSCFQFPYPLFSSVCDCSLSSTPDYKLINASALSSLPI